MKHGGARVGAGRKPGGKNRATVERQIRAAHGVAAAVERGLMPLDILLARMRGEKLPNGKEVTDDQFGAAVCAAPFLHSRLSAVAYKEVPPSPRVDLSGLSLEEKKSLLELMDRITQAEPPTVEGRR